MSIGKDSRLAIKEREKNNYHKIILLRFMPCFTDHSSHDLSSSCIHYLEKFSIYNNLVSRFNHLKFPKFYLIDPWKTNYSEKKNYNYYLLHVEDQVPLYVVLLKKRYLQKRLF